MCVGGLPGAGGGETIPDESDQPADEDTIPDESDPPPDEDTIPDESDQPADEDTVPDESDPPPDDASVQSGKAAAVSSDDPATDGDCFISVESKPEEIITEEDNGLVRELSDLTLETNNPPVDVVMVSCEIPRNVF